MPAELLLFHLLVYFYASEFYHILNLFLSSADNPPVSSRGIRGRALSNSSTLGVNNHALLQKKLEQIESDAYLSVLRAFGAQSEVIT